MSRQFLIVSTNPGRGAYSASYFTDLLNLKRDYEAYVLYIRKKRYSVSHEKKLLNFAKKLCFYGYFTYSTLNDVREELQNDCFYKAIRAVINFYKDKYYENDEVYRELDRIKKVVPEPKSKPDIFTPTREDVLYSFNKLNEINPKYAQFFLGLVLSGVRVVEFESLCVNRFQYREVRKDGFVKIVMNEKRHTKSSYFIYLPYDYSIPEGISVDYLRRILNKNKDIIRPKYLRNFFYSVCVELGISTAIADFFQGRTPISIGNKHYLEKEHHADKAYKRLLEYFEELFIK